MDPSMANRLEEMVFVMWNKRNKFYKQIDTVKICSMDKYLTENGSLVKMCAFAVKIE